MADDLGPIDLTSDPDDIPMFVRTITLPTSSLRRARAAVELQFDRFSPMPRDLAAFDVVPLRGGEEGPNYAVGIVSKARLAERRIQSGRVSIRTDVEGQTVAFRFRNAEIIKAQAQRFMSVSPSVFLALVTLSVLAGVVNYRLSRELQASEVSVAAIEKSAANLKLRQTDQQSAWSDWTAAVGDRVADNASCALQRIGRGDTPVSIKLFEAGAGAVHVTFATPLSQKAREKIDPRGDLTWLDDGDSRAQWVKFGGNVCS